MRTSTDQPTAPRTLAPQNGAGTLEATPGTPSDSLGTRARALPPALLAAFIAIGGILVLGAIVIGLGLLITKVPALAPVRRWDVSVNRWFVDRRTPTLNTLTAIGSGIGETITIVSIALITTIVLAIKRLWREVGLVLVALAVEFTVFLTTTLVVERARPDVFRLDAAPPTSSYPSGHTAAAIALYVSLAIITSAHVRSLLVRTIAWVLALALPIVVGLSRIYRGMHHPTDVLASVLLGIGALLVALLAVRAASADARARRPESAGQARR